MSEYSFPFKSNNGDRLYKAEEWRNAMRPLFTSGVFPIDPQLQVTAGAGMTVNISEGFAFLDGVTYRNSTEITKSVTVADGVLNRKDCVCVRINEENREATIVILEGIPSATPEAPSIVRDRDYYDICLAVLDIQAGITNVENAHITDTRLNPDVCGIAAPYTVPDTSGWYDNWNAEYTSWLANKKSEFTAWMSGEQAIFAIWFGTMVSTLDSNQAGNLYNLIATEAARINEQAFTAYTHTKMGTNHELTLVGGGGNVKFIATADYIQGDTFTVNGVAFAAKMPDSNDLSDGFFMTGAVVIGFISAGTIYFVGGTAMKTQVIITLEATDEEPLAGQIVTVKNTEDDSTIEEFVYSGQAHTVLVPVATHYSVSCSAKTIYVTPQTVTYTALANTPRFITMTYKLGARLGFMREKGNSHPTHRITYLFDAVGKTPVTVNMTTGDVNYGSWEGIIKRIARPVMQLYTGEVDYELDHDDQTKKIDGETASDVANTAYDGNAVVEFGKAFQWVKRYETETHEFVIFSDLQYDDDYHAYAHTNEAGEVQDAFYWGMFEGTLVGSRMRSIGTGAVISNATREQDIDRALANGDGFYTIYKSGHDYIDDLLTLISKSDDSQGVFGAGRSSGNMSAIAAGTLKNRPAFFGVSDGTTGVKVFWIENYWGNIYEGMAGLILDGGNGVKTKMTPPYNTTGDGYRHTGLLMVGSGNSWIINHSTTGESGFVAKEVGGSDNTYVPDRVFYRTNQVSYAAVGGQLDDGTGCGARCVTLGWSKSETRGGSRISYLAPQPEMA